MCLGDRTRWAKHPGHPAHPPGEIYMDPRSLASDEPKLANLIVAGIWATDGKYFSLFPLPPSLQSHSLLSPFQREKCWGVRRLNQHSGSIPGSELIQLNFLDLFYLLVCFLKSYYESDIPLSTKVTVGKNTNSHLRHFRCTEEDRNKEKYNSKSKKTSIKKNKTYCWGKTEIRWCD